jgi:uncharacterized protein (TIGR03067 family)
LGRAMKMRFLTSGLALAWLLLAVDSSWSQEKGAEGAAVTKEWSKMAGTWKIVAFEIAGKKMLPDEERAKILVTIGLDGKSTVRVDGKTVVETTNKIDPTKTPKTLDQTFTKGGGGEGKTSLAIYELKDDTLKCCFAAPGEPRPSKFEGHTLVVYKRQKGK